MIPTVTVDAHKAFARFSPAGIPEAVRNALRATLPQLGKEVGDTMERKLESGLNSRRSIKVDKLMVENRNEITVRVSARYVGGDPKKKMLPVWLETGTRPHVITARLAPVLAFYWPKIGGMFFGKQVMHPGFRGIHYAEQTLYEMEPRIVDVLSNAAKKAAAAT